MARLYNLVRFSTATTGTGTVTAGSAVSGFLTPSGASIPDGTVVTYSLRDGSASEVGRGTVGSSSTTVSRDTVLTSTNSGSKITLSGTAEMLITPAVSDVLLPSIPQGRLTLTSATPVMTSSVSGATTVYYTPYVGRYVPIYDGVVWVMHDIGAELSQATTDTTKSPAAATTNSNYDLFVWLDGATYRSTRGPAWSSDTARGTGAGTTELERIAGIWTNKNSITNGPAANRGTFVGTIRTNSSSQVDFSFGGVSSGATQGKLHVWNAYNRVDVSAIIADSTASWTYSSSTYRASNGSATFRGSYVAGLAEDCVMAEFLCAAYGGTSAGSAIGIGYDSTTSPSGLATYAGSNTVGLAATAFASYSAVSLGFHYMSAIEAVLNNGNTGTWYGTAGATGIQSGLAISGRF